MLAPSRGAPFSYSIICISIAWNSVVLLQNKSSALVSSFPFEIHSNRWASYSSVNWSLFIPSLLRERKGLFLFPPSCRKASSPVRNESWWGFSVPCLVQTTRLLRVYSLFSTCWFKLFTLKKCFCRAKIWTVDLPNPEPMRWPPDHGDPLLHHIF